MIFLSKFLKKIFTYLLLVSIGSSSNVQSTENRAFEYEYKSRYFKITKDPSLLNAIMKEKLPFGLIDEQLSVAMEFGNFECEENIRKWVYTYIPLDYFSKYIAKLVDENAGPRYSRSKDTRPSNDEFKDISITSNNINVPFSHVVLLLISFLHSNKIIEIIKSKNEESHIFSIEGHDIKVTKRYFAPANLNLVQLDFENVRVIAQSFSCYDFYYKNNDPYICIQLINENKTYCLSNFEDRLHGEYKTFERKIPLSLNVIKRKNNS